MIILIKLWILLNLIIKLKKNKFKIIYNLMIILQENTYVKLNLLNINKITNKIKFLY